MVELRALTPNEWPLWRAARLAALAQAPHAFGSRLEDWQGDGDREDRWRGRLEIPGSLNLTALVDDALAGMASGVPTSDPAVAELISMWVAPPARGAGVGDALIAAVADWARDAGAAELHLAVTLGNEPALRLYRRHGFVATGQVDPMPDGVRREAVMAKDLRPV
ncbi:MAG: GNAT family N-acetyltransferase [Mycobacteriales bacterium]